MALNSSEFVIKPNLEDGKQRLSDPDGLYDPGAGGADIQAVTGLAVVNNTHNSQTISWTYGGVIGDIDGFIVDTWVDGDSDWSRLVSLNNSTFDHQESGLSALTRSRYRVASAVETPYQISAWSEVEATTLGNPASGDETDLLSLTFFTNFEGMAHNSYMNQNMPTRFGACANFTVDANKGGAGGPGTKCGHTFMQGNNSATGWAKWGYHLKDLPRPIHNSEVWWRQAIFWPANADASHGSGAGLKQMRMERNTISGNYNRGATELLLKSGGIHNREQKLSVEYVVEDNFVDEYGKPTSGYYMGPPALQFGKWSFIEMYCKFHEDKNIGEVASWIDGVPAGRTHSYTMGDQSEWNWGYYFGTYWNGYENRSDYQEQWYDQIALAQQGPLYGGGTANDAQHLTEDRDGYLHIGTAINTDDLT